MKHFPQTEAEERKGAPRPPTAWEMAAAIKTGCDLPILLTVREACEVLRLSRSKVYELVSAGVLAPVKLGAATRFRAADLLRFIDQLPTVQTRAARGG